MDALSSDGTTIACDSRGSGPDILLVHGSGASNTFWRPVLPALEALFTVHAMDRRGHGASGDAPAYDMEREYEDVAACVAACQAQPVAVVAHSFGALCALGACRFGARIGRLVLYEPPIPVNDASYYPPGIIPAMRAALAAGDAAATLSVFLAGVHGMKQQDIARLRRLASWRGQLAAAPRLLRELEAVHDFRFVPADYAEWQVPTLLLLGGDSPPQYRATAALLHASLPASRIAVLPGQSHEAVRQAPAMFADTVLQFLRT
ncbi:MAG TPA: alpha/beta hydrolase [Acetobacteraceae bacterium]|nr:alpha/beta hydrolase [Acetobacteraceae bacterium]